MSWKMMRKSKVITLFLEDLSIVRDSRLKVSRYFRNKGRYIFFIWLFELNFVNFQKFLSKLYKFFVDNKQLILLIAACEESNYCLAKVLDSFDHKHIDLVSFLCQNEEEIGIYEIEHIDCINCIFLKSKKGCERRKSA